MWGLLWGVGGVGGWRGWRRGREGFGWEARGNEAVARGCIALPAPPLPTTAAHPPPTHPHPPRPCAPLRALSRCRAHSASSASSAASLPQAAEEERERKLEAWGGGGRVCWGGVFLGDGKGRGLRGVGTVKRRWSHHPQNTLRSP